MSRVVPPVTPLHAEPPLARRILAALRKDNGVRLPVDVVGEGASNAAVGADGIHALEFGSRANRESDRLVDQGAGRAGCRTFSARDAGALAHWGVEVKGDAGGEPLSRATQDVVVLDLVAGSDASIAEDARLVIDGDDR